MTRRSTSSGPRAQEDACDHPQGTTAADVNTIVALREYRTKWLAARGSDQWQDAGLSRLEFECKVRASIWTGCAWMATDDDGQALGVACGDRRSRRATDLGETRRQTG